jgi:tRNA-2-methylthio-N6-dimethylallyladenosine synthase
VRGPEQARPPQAIIAEAEKLVAEGCKEVTLIGQTVNSYKWSDGGKTSRLSDLLLELNKIDGLERIKFVTSYPRDMTDDLIHAVRDLPKVSHYLHVPAQHGSDDVLKRMKRGYTIGQYMEMLDRLRVAIPHAALSSDFIVGFCGETDEEFSLSLELVKTVKFKNSFIFKYSPRPGTKAFDTQSDDVPESVKKERNRLLQEAQSVASLEGNRRFVGSRQQVLVEGLSTREERRAVNPGPDGFAQLTGRTMCDRIVVFDAPLRLIGRMVDIDITSAGSWSLAGEVADGLADAVPLDFLEKQNPAVHQIKVPVPSVSRAAQR